MARMKSRPSLKPRLRPRLAAVAVAACFAATPAWSLPTGMAVANGSASASQVGNVLTVTNSTNAILNWNKFGIAAGEITKFIQPSAASSVLNRVVGGDLTAIYGTLSSNGKVWLVNPAGILIGPSGVINTAAFVASTLPLKDSDFLAGRLTFGGAGGALVNQGTITTPTGGSVYLIGTSVSNEGIINTPNGEAILAAGETVSLVDTATPGITVEITGEAGNVTNLGTIAAEAGRVGMAGVIVRNTGTLSAASAVEEGGKVFLRASRDAYVDGNGRIVATGTKGGSVEVLGERVAVMDNTVIDASGANGGGTILVGGDYQGKNPDVRNAQVTYFGPDATLKADAEKVGAGGTVVVWADDTTRAYGNISARGGADGGNGGFVETSGKRYLDIAGVRVSTLAPGGTSGAWLLDPVDVTIGHGPSTTGGSFTLVGSDNIFTPAEYGATAYINDADINGNLNTGTNVIVTTTPPTIGFGTGNITVYGDADYGGAVFIQNASGGVRSLTLQADAGIDVHAGAQIRGSSGNVLNVNMDAATGVQMSGSIFSYGGNVVINGPLWVILGDGTAGGIINARSDGTFNQTPDSGPGGRVLLGAPMGTVVMNANSFVGTSNQTRMMLPDGSLNPYGGVAIGFLAGDVAIDSTATVKLNYDGAPGTYGGGDLGFLPTDMVGLGGIETPFWLDNAELARLMMPGGNACGTGKEGCRIWIGNIGSVTDPILGPMPITTSDIFADNADFTVNGVTAGVGKRVQLATTGLIADTGDGMIGVKAGHLGLHGAHIGNDLIDNSSGADGFGFYGNSAGLRAPYGGIIFTDYSPAGSTLALRRIEAGGGATVKSAYGGITLLPYFPGQGYTAATGDIDIQSAQDLALAAYGGSYTVGGAIGAAFTETAPASAAISAAYKVTLAANGNVGIGGDHVALMDDFTVTSYGGNITLADAGIGAGNAVSLAAYGDVELTGINSGTWVQSYGGMTVTGQNILLTGGNAINAPGTHRFVGTPVEGDVSGFGAGVMLKADGAQTLTAGNEIRLQAGSTDNALHSSYQYGGSVVVSSDFGPQTLSANKIRLLAGTGGHDNEALIGTMSGGTQTINITGTGGELLLQAGGNATPTVPDPTAGSFNNNAEIANWAGGGQNITIYGGGTVTLQGGGGTGKLGYGTGGNSSHNAAQLWSYGGTQFLDFHDGGSLTLYGGSAGTNNFADIGNDGGTITVTSSQGSAYFPNVLLQGGASGGGQRVGGDSRTNDAGIWTGEYGGSIWLDVNNLTINGGNATYGGAGVGSLSLNVLATGNVALTGGGSNSLDPGEDYPAGSSGAFLGGEGSGSITLDVAGTLTLTGGTGTSGPAAIGTATGTPTININTGGDVVLTAGASPALIGSVATGYGASITVNSGGDLTLTGNATAGAMIGSMDDALSSTSVTLNASRDFTATDHVQLGVKTPSDTQVNSVTVKAGYDGYGGGVSGYGGDLMLGAAGPVMVNAGALGSVQLVAYESSGGTLGSLSLSAGSQAYGDAVSLTAAGNIGLGGQVTGVSYALLEAGWDDASSARSMRGGDLTLLTGSGVHTLIDYVDLYAWGNAGGYGGSIVQQAGSSVASDGLGIYAYADRGLQINGSLSGYGGVQMTAGYSGLTGTSGNMVFAGNVGSAGGQVNLYSYADAAGVGGNVTQTAGTLYGGVGVFVGAYGDAAFNGTLASSGPVSIHAGWTNPAARTLSVASVSGGSIDLSSSGGLTINGPVTSTLTEILVTGGIANLGGTLAVYGDITGAAGVSLSNSAGVYQAAGSDIYGGAAGGIFVQSGGDAQLNGTLAAGAGSSVTVLATAGTGPQHLTVNNVTSDAINLISSGNLTTNGTLTSTVGNVTLNAGLTYGGTLTVNGGIDAAGMVSLNNAGGSIIQTAGTVYGGTGVVAYAYGDAIMSGTIEAAPGSGVTVWSGYMNTAPTHLSVATVTGNAINLESTGNVTVGGDLTAAAGGIGIYAALGNVNLGGGAIYGFSNVYVEAVGSSPAYGGIALAGGSVTSPGGVSFLADGNISIGGTAIIAGNPVNLIAGNAGPATFTVDGDVSSGGMTTLRNAGGDMVQGTGSTVGGAGGLQVAAFGDAIFSGVLESTGGMVDASAGSWFGNPLSKTLTVVDVHGSTVSLNSSGDVNVTNAITTGGHMAIAAGSGGSYGGSINLGSGIITTNTYFSAMALESGGYGGNITKTSGSITSGGNIVANAYRNMSLSGAGLVSGGTVILYAGYAGYGGTMAVGNVSGATGVQLQNDSGGITQAAGSTIYGGPGVGAQIYASGDAIMNGTLTAGPGSGVTVQSGYTNPAVPSNLSVATVTGDFIILDSTGNATVGGPLTANVSDLAIYAGNGTGTSGNISLGSNVVTSYGGDITLLAYGNSGSGGISQTGGSINAATGSILISADGGGSLAGSVTSGTSGVAIYAGLNGYGGTLTLSGNVTAGTNADLYNYSGSINQTAGTIAAPNVYIHNEGAPADKFIALNVVDAGEFGAVTINSSGAILDNNGAATNIIGYDVSLISQNGGTSGGLAISADTMVSAGGYLDAYVAGGSYGGIRIANVSYGGGMTAADAPWDISLEDYSTNGGPITFSHAGSLNLDDYTSYLSVSGTGDAFIGASGDILLDSSGMSLGSSLTSIIFSAGANMTADSFGVSGDLGLGAGGTLNIVGTVAGANVAATASVVNISGAISAGGTAFAGGGSVNIIGGSVYGDAGVAMMATGNIVGDGAYIHSYMGNVMAEIGGDLRLNNGSEINAGDDVRIRFSGGNSTLYLNDAPGMVSSYIVADTYTGVPATIYLEFINRLTGTNGVIIDGVPTLTSLAGGSGLFSLNHSTPATTDPGGGLEIVGLTMIPTDPCAANPLLCKPPTDPDDPTIGSVSTEIVGPGGIQPGTEPQTIGGTEDSFGDKKDEEKDKDKQGKDETKGKKDDDKGRKKVAQCTT